MFATVLSCLMSAAPVPAVAVEQRAAAAAASRAGQHVVALKAADAAVKAAPSWPDAFFTRAAVQLSAAGAASEIEALKHPQPGVDYKQLRKSLEGAAADLRKFLQLQPEAPNRDVVLEVVGELSVRINLAGEAASQPVELPCYDGQERIKGRCRGVAQCPPGRYFDAAKETCACSPGTVSATSDPFASCCWPNQTWSEQTGACVGTPKCAAGFRLLPSLAACLPPAGDLVSQREPDGICEDGKKGFFLLAPKDLEQKLDLHRTGDSFEDYWSRFFQSYPTTLDYEQIAQALLVESGKCRQAMQYNGGFACCGRR